MVSIGGNNPRRGQVPVLDVPNRGRTALAQREIDQMVGRYNQRYTNGVKVNGHPVRIWNRVIGATLCTCQKASHPLPDSTHQGTARRGYADEGSDPSQPIPLKKSRWSLNDDRIYPTDTAPEAQGVQIAGLNPQPAQGSIGQQIQHRLSEVGSQERLLADMMDVINVTDTVSCPICFGAGMVDAWKLINGTRVLLDNSLQRPPSSGNVADVSKRPHRFELGHTGAAVRWNGVELPTYFHDATVVRVWSGKEPANGLNIEASLDSGTTWVPLTLTWLRSRKGVATKADIRVVCPSEVPGALLWFTHAEILYDNTEPLYANFPQFQESQQHDRFAADIQGSLEVEPRCSRLNKEAVIESLRTGELWRLMDVTNKKTAKNQGFGFVMQVERLRIDSRFQQMKTGFQGRDWPHIPWRGLEHTQGGVLTDQPRPLDQ